MKDRDQGVERPHKVHIVIDHNQRGRLIDALDDRDQSLGLHIGEAGGGLVEQNKPRLVGEHGADLDKLPLTMGEFADQPACDAAQFEFTQGLFNDGVGAIMPRGPARGKPQIFRDGEPVHHRWHLGFDADAESHDIVRRPAGGFLAAD